VKSGAKKLLIVVDDEPDITSALKLGLERRGMDVTTFNDPLKALEELKRRNYDLVLTDIRMPKLSGFDLYREMRKQGVDTPIVFMTAFDVYQKEFERMFPELKPKALLRKPVGVAELATRVHEILDNRE
jgi:DNA-binding response OmpR family regulator